LKADPEKVLFSTRTLLRYDSFISSKL